MKASERVVVCAAIKNKRTGEIICGARHGDCLNFASRNKIGEDFGSVTWECGFVDADNVFMTRSEAWKVADSMGQIRRPNGFERNFKKQRAANVGDEGLLFSENLY